ncbi:hypothetical protein AXG93_1923s1230 [Marchantia polymorpha subsp. ruderalis]|uniref:dolichyl-phosphate beta-glucosyltransferase n=1 Tax=Marchantia polymorpha subsp. ruderalis TaxID=1480154 RepID=A0A176VDB1_MARPO|nr:hypothetical protein AXG93_1923s1230 [Marchantia polymorpha subsp. ruderalis]
MESLPSLSALVSPLTHVGLVVMSLIVIWALTYVMDWLHKLDSSASLGEGTVSFMEDPTSLEKIQLPSVFGPAEKYLSMIMPAYNEENRLRSGLDDTLRYLQERANKDRTFTYEIIIVDDGSKDHTVRVANEYVKKYKPDIIRVIKLGKNLGKGAAVRKGMLCSRGQLLLMLDADGATKITDTGKLENEMKVAIDRLLASRSATTSRQQVSLNDIPVAVFGSRAHLEQEALAKRKWYRNVLMKGFHFCVLLVAGPGIRDTQLFIAHHRFGSTISLSFSCKGPDEPKVFPLSLVCWLTLFQLIELAIPVTEVAVTWTEIPGSKVSLLSIAHMLFELVLIRMGYGFRVWKIHRKAVQD